MAVTPSPAPRTYAACYCKTSNRMHKVYDEDGVLEVTGNKMVLFGT